MNNSLIANSGIQFFSKEIELNLNDGFKQVFYEWFDEEQVEQVLEYAYEIKQLGEFVKMSDLLKYGFIDHSGNLLVEPNVIAANPEVRTIHKGDISGCAELFRLKLEDKNSCVLDKYLNCWLPAPYYEVDQTGNFKLGPYNWCRFKIEPVSQENGVIKANILIAFDTHAAYGLTDDYNECPSFLSENEKIFGLCSNPDKLIDYCSGKNDWIRLYLMKLVYNTDDINKIPPQQPYKYSFLASYYMLVSYLASTANLPNIKLIRDRDQEEMMVEMIIDIGNSRTSAILFENSDFTKVSSLKLQNFSKPLLKNGQLNRVEDSFSMRIAFSKVDFGGNMEGSSQFTWPSLIRLGSEAEYLSHEATNISFTKQTLSTYSSPKRYLWDFSPREDEWRFVNLGESIDLPPILKGISNYFNYDGTIEEGGYGTGANYSRKSLMTFAFLEILAQATSQINSHDYREYNGNLNTPRRINKIILTCPTAMSKYEQESLHSSLETAIFVLNKFYNNIDSSRIPFEISIEPKLSKDSNDNSPWIFDEATCSQFVYLYSILTERYKNMTKEFFEIYGKSNLVENVNKPSLTIGTLDIGAGTSDVTICSYEFNAQKPSQLKPTPLFWDSFDYAGDDMLRVLINNILIESEDGILQKELAKGGLTQSQIYSKLFDFFGKDHNRLSFKDRMVRRDFNIQVSVPIMYYFLNLLSEGEHYREISFEEIFAKQQPSQVVIDAFNEKMGLDLKSIRWTFDSKVMSKHIEHAMDGLLENVATIMYAYKCDIVLLSGRPSSLKVIRDIFLKYFAVSPDRLISLNKFCIGHWYPFADRNGYLCDSKSVVPVGAMIAYKASHAGYNGFLLNLSELGNKIMPTTEFYAKMDRNRRDAEWFISPEVNTGSIVVDSFPAYIGTKQFDISNYPIRPFYVFDIDEKSIKDRIRKQYEENDVELTLQEIQIALQEEKDKILAQCPLTVTLIREDYKENKEVISIDTIKGDSGDELNIRNFKLEIQSLNDPECYWLDSGEFNINTISNVNRDKVE